MLNIAPSTDEQWCVMVDSSTWYDKEMAEEDAQRRNVDYRIAQGLRQ